MTGDRSFRAMGCEVIVRGADPPTQAAIASLFAARDASFSRFRRPSELNRVNAASRPLVVVSSTFARALRASLDAAQATGGLVDPTLGVAIESAGYAADFATLRPDRLPPGPASPGAWHSVSLHGRLLRRPPGVKLDLNGIVKAMAVDDAVALLPGEGFVSAGGDLAVRGALDVSLPGGGAVRLVAGALATSGSARRHWLRDGRLQHHLIDPRTGRPAGTPWQQVSVCGATCVDADVAAKAAFLLGREGPGWLEERCLPGRFLRHDGAVVVTADWRAAVGPEPACT